MFQIPNNPAHTPSHEFDFNLGDTCLHHQYLLRSCQLEKLKKVTFVYQPRIDALCNAPASR
jgi:hypothetical protein